MFGFGNKTWEDNDIWYHETTFRMFTIYNVFLSTFHMLYIHEKLDIKTFDDLNEKLFKSDLFFNSKDSNEAIYQISANLRTVATENQLKVAYETEKKLRDWVKKNEPTKLEYISFRKKHLEILNLMIDIFKQLPLISKYAESLQRVSSYSPGKLQNVEIASYTAFLTTSFTVVYELSMKLSKLINNDISNEYEEIKKTHKK